MVTEKNNLATIHFDHQNHRGEPCKVCGEAIQVYSLSGLCRKCWHERRTRGRVQNEKPKQKPLIVTSFCKNCGVPQNFDGLCPHCQQGDTERLTKYRLFRLMPEHRYVYQMLRGELAGNDIVHHLNGLKGDNRIENLCAVSRSDHDTKSIVHELQKRIRELEGR